MCPNKNMNVCTGSSQLIFSCSGAADTGEISDRAARKLTHQGKGRMFCLAGIGGRVDPILKQTASAENILVIDGCPLDCTRRTLEEAGFREFHHIRVTDLGFEKGKTAVNETTITTVAQNAEPFLT